MRGTHVNSISNSSLLSKTKSSPWLFRKGKERSGEIDLRWKPKKDIVRTYIPGDICPHNVCTMSAQHLTKDICLTRDIPREMLCEHSADIVRTYISRDISPHHILLRFSALVDVVLKRVNSVGRLDMLVSVYFYSLACGAGFYIMFYVSSHAWPKVPLDILMVCHWPAWVSLCSALIAMFDLCPWTDQNIVKINKNKIKILENGSINEIWKVASTFKNKAWN